MPHARFASVCLEGRNRFVLLLGRHAIKFPSLRTWRDFLFGLLNNMNEARASTTHPAYCPVIWCAPGGFLLVMPRVQVMGDEFWQTPLPHGTAAEMKPSSWGWLNGKPVAIDYGWP